jgi:nicotinamide mononucleotide (NMN) deamidase PncC
MSLMPAVLLFPVSSPVFPAVSFTKLPEGYTYPEGNTAASPMVLYRGGRAAAAAAGTTSGGTAAGSIGGAPGSSSVTRGSFLPCNNRRFKKFMQAVSRTLPDGGVVLTSKCD